MEEAVIIRHGEDTGLIVPIYQVSDNSHFDPLDPEMLFFENGWLRRFKKGDTAYMALFNSEANGGEFLGYYPEENFWDHNSSANQTIIGTESSTRKQLGDRFDKFTARFPDNARVHLSHKTIIQNPAEDQVFLLISHGFGYFTDAVTPEVKNLGTNITTFTLSEATLLEGREIPINRDEDDLLFKYTNYVLDKQRLLPNGMLAAWTDNQRGVIFDIVHVFNAILDNPRLVTYLKEQGVYETIKYHLQLPTRYGAIDDQVDLDYHYTYTAELFARFRLQLIELRYWLFNFRRDYNRIDRNHLLVYVVNLFTTEELSLLSYDTKIGLLKGLIDNNYWIIGNWFFNAVNEEQAIVKVVRSMFREDVLGRVNYEEINTFLDFLNTPYDGSSGRTLYQILYNRVNDNTFFGDDGQGSKGQLVKTIYNLWLESKYNPLRLDPLRDPDEIAAEALAHFHYTPYAAYWQVDFDSILRPEFDPTAAPMMIGYESEKILLWYQDNFKFSFGRNKVVAKIDLPDYGYQPFGFYDLYQPVALKATDANDTIIKMPVQGIAEVSSPADLEFINNCMPIFYLQYVDDVGDYSDAKETIGVVLDVILTFTGVGNISKLRHLRHLSLVRKLRTGLSAAEKIAFTRALGRFASAAEAMTGLLSLIYNLATANCTVYFQNDNSPPDPSDPAYQDYLYCQLASKWLFALEIASLSGDLLARRAFKRATREFIENIPAGTKFDETRRALNSLETLDSLDAVLMEFLDQLQAAGPPRSEIFLKVSGFRRIENGVEVVDKEKQFSFLYDVQGRPSLLDDFADDLELVDMWSEIEHLRHVRRDVGFLITYRKIKSSPDFIEHIVRGQLNPDTRFPTVLEREKTFANNGFPNIPKYEAIGLHTLKQPIPNDIRIERIVLGPNSKGYYTAFYRKKPGNSWRNPNPGIHPDDVEWTKAKKSTMFPDSWTQQKINEEIALAFSNRIGGGEILDSGQIKFELVMTDGTDLVVLTKMDGSLVTAYPLPLF